jgi:hypothetical protein
MENDNQTEIVYYCKDNDCPRAASCKPRQDFIFVGQKAMSEWAGSQLNGWQIVPAEHCKNQRFFYFKKIN